MSTINTKGVRYDFIIGLLTLALLAIVSGFTGYFIARDSASQQVSCKEGASLAVAPDSSGA